MNRRLISSKKKQIFNLKFLAFIELVFVTGIALLIVSCSKTTSVSSGKAEIVKLEAARCWRAYKEYAWGHDAANPISKTPHDWYEYPLLMTPVDAFDTFFLMGLKEEAEEAKQLIFERLDFDKDMFVQQFEITIRLLASLISSYQLDGDERFLDLAVDLGNRLLAAYDSPTGMPYVMVNLKTGETRGKISNPTEVGCMMLELGALSKITGNPVYYEKCKTAVEKVYSLRSEIGLVGNQINVETGEWTGTECHLGGGIDGFYEYLLKAWLLFDDSDFKAMWDESIKALNKYLATEKETGFYYTRVDMNTGKETTPYFGALEAFFPAVLVLHGDIDRAKKLLQSCYQAWTRYGIEPETYNINTLEVGAPFYILRPEIVESTYYLYSFTKEPQFKTMGEKMWNSLVRYCRTDVAFAGIKDVRTMEKVDRMESFFFAETLKYFYLLFSPQEIIDFEKIVFTTEAHPIRKDW